LQSSGSEVVTNYHSSGSNVVADYHSTTTKLPPDDHSTTSDVVVECNNGGSDVVAAEESETKNDFKKASVELGKSSTSSVVNIDRDIYEEIERERKKSDEKSRIKLVFREAGTQLSEDKYRVKKYLEQEKYKKLKNDVYLNYEGICATCGKSVNTKDARLLEKYELKEIDGKKKMVLKGMELVCDYCYILKTADRKKIEEDSSYKKYVYLSARKGLGIEELTEEELANFIVEERKRMEEIQEEYGKLNMGWLKENGYK